MPRLAIDVVQELLEAMVAMVRDYHPEVGRTGTTVDELIEGTAFFPGGCGLWRGSAPRGPMPTYFPEEPIMLVAHNFDSIESYKRSKAKGGEVPSTFWLAILVPILDAANIKPDRVFFTNALMGCKPGSATGPMPTFGSYENQCLEFLRRQIQIVRPLVAVGLGDTAWRKLRKIDPNAAKIMHPSAREFIPLDKRDVRFREQGKRLAQFVSQAR